MPELVERPWLEPEKQWLREVKPRSIESFGRALEAMRPPPRLTVHEWAEAERIVPRGTSARHGRWHSRPFQKPVLEALTDPLNTDGTLYVAPSQLGGKTEFLANSMGYFIACAASPQIFVTYSLDMAKKLSKRFAKTIAATPSLASRVRDPRKRDSENTIFEKSYDGGEVTFVGSQSAGGLSMAPKRVALFDEIDRYPVSAGDEGSPIDIALARVESYWNRVIAYVTSPGVRDTSASWELWQRSDKREWHVACPECAAEQVLEWSQVIWQKDEEGRHLPETAVYSCKACGAAWGDVDRWKACDAGRYIATAPFSGLAGFRISALAIATVPLERLVRQWLAAQGNPEKLKVFKTTKLAEWWDAEFRAVDETGLMERRETLPMHEGRILVPAQCPLITAGVDVQDNRFEISVYAWASREESWLLDHAYVMGNTADPAIWDALDEYLLRPWPRAAGGVDWIRGACIDTGGHRTNEAYDFCGPRYRRRTPDGGQSFVFAIKGSTGAGEIWPRKPSSVTSKVPLWSIRVDPAKETIYGRLALLRAGPGYIHLSDQIGRDFCEAMTSEKCEVTLDKRTRKPVRRWRLKVAGSRNEPLDCAAYALAAVEGLKAHGLDLEVMVRELAVRRVYETPETPQESEAPAPAPAGEPARPRRRSGWLGDTGGWLR